MRKLKLQIQMTVDGFIAGPNGEMDWMTLPWTEDINGYVREITESVDTIVLGRKLAEGFIPYWDNAAQNPDDPDFEGGTKMSAIPKFVFTKTIKKSIWNNTEVINGELVEEINKLKNKSGKDMVVYGGATFVTSLIQAGLIDEFHLLINPTAIGNGMTIFKSLDKMQKLKLKVAKQFDCGIALNCYELDKQKND